MTEPKSLVITVENDGVKSLGYEIERHIQESMNLGWTFKTAVPIQSEFRSGGRTEKVLLIFVREDNVK